MPAGCAGWDPTTRHRLDGLCAEARDERLARDARAAARSPRRQPSGQHSVVPQAGAAKREGTN